MGGDAMDNPEITTIGGNAVEGFMHTTFPYDPSMPDMNPVAKKFTDDWKTAHPDKNKEPNVNAALGYDAYMIIMDAITRAGKADSQAITDALAATKGFVGVTGEIIFDEDGQRVEPPYDALTYEDGKIVKR